jgi:hypothetical protein
MDELQSGPLMVKTLTGRHFVDRVSKLYVNLLSVYQMKNYTTKKKLIFTPNVVEIYDMKTNSRVATDEVNHLSRLFTFSEFIELDSTLLLTHTDESSRIWHERFRNLNFIYIQQIRNKILVDGLPEIHLSKQIYVGFILGKHPQEKFDTGKTQRDSSPLDLIHSDLMSAFFHPSIRKSRFVFIFVDDFSRFTWIYFLRKNHRYFNSSKISKPWLRHSQERK